MSLVDPDNRAPVDFPARQRALGSQAEASSRDLTDPRIKQFILARILAVRKHHSALFENGAYLPLQIDGPLAENVVAFAPSSGRLLRDHNVLPFARPPDESGGGFATHGPEWNATKLMVPAELQCKFSNVLTTGQPFMPTPALRVGPILRDWPVALLTEAKN